MTRIMWVALLAAASISELTSAQAADTDVKAALTKLVEHTTRLEEQNKATQQQSALLERQMEKRFDLMGSQMNQRFDLTSSGLRCQIADCTGQGTGTRGRGQATVASVQ